MLLRHHLRTQRFKKNLPVPPCTTIMFILIFCIYANISRLSTYFLSLNPPPHFSSPSGDPRRLSTGISFSIEVKDKNHDPPLGGICHNCASHKQGYNVRSLSLIMGPQDPELHTFFHFVNSTGHLEPFRTLRATLPIRYFPMPDLPRDAITIRSIPCSFPSFSISS